MPWSPRKSLALAFSTLGLLVPLHPGGAAAQEDAQKAILYIGDSVTNWWETENFPELAAPLIPWARHLNMGRIGTTTVDAVPREQITADEVPAYRSYWKLLEAIFDSQLALDRPLPELIHIMFGVNDAEGAQEVCSTFDSNPRVNQLCPVRGAEYFGSLLLLIDAIEAKYAEGDRASPLILLSSPTFSPRTTVNPRRVGYLEDYEEYVHRIVRMKPNVCFGINGRALLEPTIRHFRHDRVNFDWHPTEAGQRVLAAALARRVEALSLASWSGGDLEEWEYHLDSSWIDDHKPAWFHYSHWRSASGGRGSRRFLLRRFEWRRAQRRWLRENWGRGASEWRSLCDGATATGP